jgi:cytosine/adenosine deaminase-related metal-dependent hydrolase
MKIADGTTVDTHFLQNQNQVSACEKECFVRPTRGFGWQGVLDTSVAHFHNALELCFT